MDANVGRLLLATLLVAPLVGVAMVAVVSRKPRIEHRNAALGVSLGVLLIAVLVMLIHLRHPDALGHLPALVERPFVLFASPLLLRVDGLSVWLVLLTAVLVPVSIVASTHSIQRQTAVYYSLLMLLECAMLGVFLAGDLLWFYIFFEFTLIPLFFIIGLWGGRERRRAAFMFFIYTLAGSMLMLAVVLFMGVQSGGQFDLERVATAMGELTPRMQMLLLAGLIAGLAIKVPLFPLHTWLPLAHTEAPTAGSVLLAGVLLKLGTYGFLRLGLGLLPKAVLLAAPTLAAVGVAGILYGALAAWRQADFKRLVAYSSIAHLGFCILGLFALRPAAITGAVLVMVNHGLSTGALFVAVGMIYDRYHTRQFADLGGLGRRMPVIASFLVLFALSSLGLPGLNGFVSEFLVLIGSVDATRPGADLPAMLNLFYVALAALGIVLSAVYLLHLVGSVVFGPLKEPPVHASEATARDSAPRAQSPSLPPDANATEWSILVPLAALIVFLGVWPWPVTRSIDRDAARMIRNVAAAQPDAPPVQMQDH